MIRMLTQHGKLTKSQMIEKVLQTLAVEGLFAQDDVDAETTLREQLSECFNRLCQNRFVSRASCIDSGLLVNKRSKILNIYSNDDDTGLVSSLI